MPRKRAAFVHSTRMLVLLNFYEFIYTELTRIYIYVFPLHEAFIFAYSR